MHKANLHILIAEDDEDDRDIMQECFESHPTFSQVHLVANGQELLQYLRDGKNPLPDVILTDINMPILDGIRALEEIKVTDPLKNIPAFVYSTSTNPTYMTRCMELGVIKFLIKPYDLEGFHKIAVDVAACLP